MSDPKIGSEIGSYTITKQLGQGGVGAVYLAQHPTIGKEVAVKFLHGYTAQDSDSAQRFIQEAKVVNEIRHPNLVDVLDLGYTKDGDLYMLMELLDGVSLQSTIESYPTPLPFPRIAHIALQVCSALYASHQKGIVHRDLKSDNIFLINRDGKEDFVKVFDFGFAKLSGEQKPLANTSPGITVGTPRYMSPEQAFGRDIDHQTDIYALGIILYRMATKTYPFNDENPFAIAQQQITAPLTPPSQLNKTINPKLEKIIQRCLEKRKERRYQSMYDVAEALAASAKLDLAPYFYQRPLPTKKKREIFLYGGVIAGLVAVGFWAGAALLRVEPAQPPAQPAESAPATEPATTQATTQEATSEPSTLVAESRPSPKKTTKPKRKTFQWGGGGGFFK